MEAAWLWTIYFWVAVLVFGGYAIGRMVLYFTKPGLVSRYEVAISMSSFPVLVALWGFIHSEAYLRPWVCLGAAER